MKLTRRTDDVFQYGGDPECDRVAEVMLEIDDIDDADAFSVRPSERPFDADRNIILFCRYRIDGRVGGNEVPLPREIIRDGAFDLKGILRDLCNRGAASLRRQLANHGGDFAALLAADRAALASWADDYESEFQPEFLATLTVPELVGMQHDLRAYGDEDRAHLDAVLAEIKRRDEAPST